MRLTNILTLSVLLTICACQPSRESPSANVLWDQIDSLVSDYSSTEQFVGSVLVADAGTTVFEGHYGFQDLDSSTAITKKSVYEIASISKPFTALLVMMLREDGALDYDDLVSSHLPSFPYEDITIRHLLTHTSGLSERRFFMWAGQNLDQTKIHHNERILAYLQQEQPGLSFMPGTQWEYSNVGYFLLPLIIQEITGKHYITVLNERIFDPLGMSRSGIYSQQFKGSEMESYVFGKIFNPRDSGFMPAFGMAWSDSIYGSVGIISNPTDLLKWDQALYEDLLISQEALAPAFTAHQLANDSTSGYGFGWYVRENYLVGDKNVGKRLDHNGLWPGYESSIVRYVDQSKTIIVMSSQSPSVKDQLLEEISTLLFKE